MLATENTNATTVSLALQERGFAPYYGTPCGILAPLYAQLETDAGLVTVVREDNAVAMAAGSAMAGKSPVVLMQNSGFGQSVNAVASLVVPYGIAMLLVIGMRGIEPDFTAENDAMGRLTELVLAEAEIPFARLDTDNISVLTDWSHHLVVEQRQTAALLVPPAFFGWRA